MRRYLKSILGLTTPLLILACTNPNNAPTTKTASCDIFVAVLGTAQDAGKPQISVHSDPAWKDPAKARLASSLGLINRQDSKRYLFDASPDIRRQAYALDQLDDGRGFALDGVFLTHGHMGHYLGLAHLGKEAMSAKAVPVYAMPKMANFLRDNGPWNQLVTIKNIDIQTLSDGAPIRLSAELTVTPFQVPHRSEYTETVGYRIEGPNSRAVYLPDIDSWTAWEAQGGSLEALVTENDRLYLDASFFSGAELPGRDMSLIPHPTISTTMEKLKHMPAKERAKIHFTHMNHTNPAHDKTSKAYAQVKANGFNVAQEGESFCLSE